MDNSGSAFPILERGGNGLELTDTGITRRDYFAAKALQALLSRDNALVVGADFPENNEIYARVSYILSDAMLKVRGE